MSFLTNDAILRMGDIVGNASVGQVSVTQQVRAVDQAINYLKRNIGFPQDEKINSFYYSDDVDYYPVATDFQEHLGLFYNNQNMNTVGREWVSRPYTEVLVRNGSFPSQNTVAHTTINGSHQLLLWGTNVQSGGLIESFDQNVWTPSGDASANALDTTVFEQGSASNNFTLTYSSGTGTLTSPAISLSLSQLFQQSGNLNLYTYLSGIPTSIAIRLISTTGNYYTITATNASGSAFTLNTWNKITFPTTAAITTLAPNANSITSVQIIFTIPNTFGTVQNMRIDNLYSIYPDLLNHVYYSNLKGTNAALSPISVTTAVSDIIQYDADYVEPVALKAAIYLWPQLRGDLNYLQVIQGDLKEMMNTYTRLWPKKRQENNWQRTRLMR